MMASERIKKSCSQHEYGLKGSCLNELYCILQGATFSFKNALIVSQHRVEEGTNLHRTKSDKVRKFII